MTLNSFLDQIPDKRCPCCGKFPMQKSMEANEKCRKCGKRHRTITYHCDYCEELVFVAGEDLDHKEKIIIYIHIGWNGFIFALEFDFRGYAYDFEANLMWIRLKIDE